MGSRLPLTDILVVRTVIQPDRPASSRNLGPQLRRTATYEDVHCGAQIHRVRASEQVSPPSSQPHASRGDSEDVAYVSMMSSFKRRPRCADLSVAPPARPSIDQPAVRRGDDVVVVDRAARVHAVLLRGNRHAKKC